MGTLLTILFAIVYLVVIIFLISLASRFVRAVEYISDSVATIAKKKPGDLPPPNIQKNQS